MRTPYGRRGGALSGWHPVDLLAVTLIGLLERAGVGAELVEDVVMGCGAQVGAQAGNIARRAALAAGWPEHVPGVTVERQASSSAQAVQWAAQLVMGGVHELVVAGGVDAMSVVPLGANLALPTVGKPFGKLLSARYQEGGGLVAPGRAAEEVARHWGLTRESLDRWALVSSQRAKAAGRRAPYILPVPLGDRRAGTLKTDEGPASAPSAKSLRSLPPLFDSGGTITAGNLAAEADGAAALLIASPRLARRLGLAPKARFVSSSVAAQAPSLWPVATAAATEKLLSAASRELSQVDRYEILETSAAAVLAWSAVTGADEQRVNPEGGCLASGAPLGAAGAGLFVGAVSALARGSVRSVLVSTAGDGGVATACLLERP